MKVYIDLVVIGGRYTYIHLEVERHNGSKGEVYINRAGLRLKYTLTVTVCGEVYLH